ncbi:hypothetical protein BDQ12DRAFT_737201 [Crucibulum laeve]|uniref:Uncharacterized protein n=1 Tax=Crucibulum laeve TaxID=68775 RepID=A0A5C3LSE2_9AGAR|nr:hypothetical protein BDQ12DRAFT_737201 [Crucibulum laeve]
MSYSSSYSSTASLVSKQTPSKNYEAAFGSLSSTYGLGSSIPSLPKRSTNEKKSKHSSSDSKATAPSDGLSQPAKNYEAALGSLLTSYGFGGGVPLPSSRKT